MLMALALVWLTAPYGRLYGGWLEIRTTGSG